VLAACWDRDWVASPCWDPGSTAEVSRPLWVVPIDGSPATAVTPTPTCPASRTGLGGPVYEYSDALAAGGLIAATHRARIACSGDLDLIGGDDEVTSWLSYPGPSETWWACDPELIAARGDRLLVFDWVFQDRPEPQQGFGVIFDLAVDGTALRVLSPVERGRYGGVLQVFTTEETAFTVGPW
jgi:hypothetical protein